jgi:hypothetical protein
VVLDLFEGRGEGARLHVGPLYPTPMIPILVLAASMPVIGQARAIVRGFHERLQTHVRMGPGAVRQAEKPALQRRLARAEIEIRQAERTRCIKRSA